MLDFTKPNRRWDAEIEKKITGREIAWEGDEPFSVEYFGAVRDLNELPPSERNPVAKYTYDEQGAYQLKAKLEKTGARVALGPYGDGNFAAIIRMGDDLAIDEGPTIAIALGRAVFQPFQKLKAGL